MEMIKNVIVDLGFATALTHGSSGEKNERGSHRPPLERVEEVVDFGSVVTLTLGSGLGNQERRLGFGGVYHATDLGIATELTLGTYQRAWENGRPTGAQI